MTAPVVNPLTPFAVPDQDRLQAALERVVELILPRVMGQLACFCQWEYRVAAIIPGTPALPGAGGGTPISLSLVPVDAQRNPFGALPKVPVWKGPEGSPSVPPVGSIVTVGFHDGNPSKPAVMQMDPTIATTLPVGLYAQPAPLTLAGALAAFATGLNPGTLSTQATALLAQLANLL